MNDLISVIVPAYNAEAFIERCLNSIIKQTYRNLEIICIDDCSSDRTTEIIRKFSDPRIRLVEHRQNQGISITRNHGMEIANGSYIGFIDADDLIDPDFYEKLYQSAITNNAQVVTTATSAEWPDKTKLWAGRPGVYQTLPEKLAAVRNGSCWNKLYRTDFLRQNKLQFPAGLIAEDNYFIIRCLCLCDKLAAIDTTCYHYIMNPTSLTHSPQKQEERKRDSLAISQMILQLVDREAPRHKKEVTAFILKNIVLSQYLADKNYYCHLKKAAGFSWLLCKTRFKALRRKWTRKFSIQTR